MLRFLHNRNGYIYSNSKIFYFISNSRKFCKASKRKWKSVVGLEVHAQITSNSKLFSSTPSNFFSPVNLNVSLFDSSVPGTLPILNKRCVEAGVLTALAVGSNLNPVCSFDRKHYFYNDMPAGYQITQQRSPLASGGQLNFFVPKQTAQKVAYEKSVNIKQLQLEQDSGKLLHAHDKSLIDLNRAGIPLMELVFEPDLTDGEEAAALIKELVRILKRIQTCSCRMEEGALRVDANVSINREGEPLGTRTEIKNIASVRGVANAVQYEIKRQILLKESGEDIVNETRSWDVLTQKTVSMRDKEKQQDYRFMPEPNLPPLFLSIDDLHENCVNVGLLRKSLPELPAQTRLRLKNSMGLTEEHVMVLANDDTLLNLYETLLKYHDQLDYKLAANILLYDFLGIIYKSDYDVEHFISKGEYIGEVVKLHQTRQINRLIVVKLLTDLTKGETKMPLEIVQRDNLFQISDETELTKICQDILNENEVMVRKYRAGKVKIIKAFMGMIVQKTNQRADMAKCDKILKTLLKP